MKEEISYCNWSYKVFPGFYESNLWNSDTLYNAFYGEVPEGYYLEIEDWERFTKEECVDWLEAIKDNFLDNPLDMEIGELLALRSPREYNFTTDKLLFSLKVDVEELKKYCWENCKDEFDKYLHDHFTSYDGFCSFIANNLYEFKQDYEDDTERLNDIMIEFYLLKNVDFVSVEMDVLEDQFEKFIDNTVLVKEEDWSKWEYTCENEKLVPTAKLE